MRLGIHMRISGGILPSLDAAYKLGCETVQLFASNPNAWRFTVQDPDEAEVFAEKCWEWDIRPVTLHTAYLLNLASPDDELWLKSINALTLSLKRADMLRAEYVVTHIGSHGGSGLELGIRRVCEAVRRSVEDAGGKSMVLLESGAGAGNSVGSKFEELGALLDGTSDVSDRVGICLDAAHLYGAGYDISSGEGVHSVVEQFDWTVGLERLKFFHLNDTQKELGSHVDRHWHVGEGNVGIEGFRAILNHPGLSHIAGVIETPEKELGMDEVNLGKLRELRKTGLSAED
jgi:deoxyribonuclease-4